MRPTKPGNSHIITVASLICLFLFSNWFETNLLIAYWIAFGPHGPLAQSPPDENRKVILYTAVGILFSFTLFASMRAFGGQPPSTMTKEYQEATNEFLKVSRRPP